MKIVAVDPGTRNLGLVVYENEKLTHFGCYDLFDYAKKKNERTDYALLTYNFIKAHPEIFNGMDKILIEVQMQSRMKLICNTLRVMHWHKAIKISPLGVKNYFKIGKGNHRKNKKAGIKFVENFLSSSQFEKIKKHTKFDDICDCVIMIHYYLKKYCKVK
jgi:hypothetical protein